MQVSQTRALPRCLGCDVFSYPHYKYIEGAPLFMSSLSENNYFVISIIKIYTRACTIIHEHTPAFRLRLLAKLDVIMQPTLAGNASCIAAIISRHDYDVDCFYYYYFKSVFIFNKSGCMYTWHLHACPGVTGLRVPPEYASGRTQS